MAMRLDRGIPRGSFYDPRCHQHNYHIITLIKIAVIGRDFGFLGSIFGFKFN
jgi:hypothetical protein